MTTPAVCSGGNAIIDAGGTCAGYEGIIEVAGDPNFVDAVGDCVSWDLDFYISTDAANALGIDCQDVTALDLQPGPPTYAFGDGFTDITGQGYVYIGTFNNCSQVSIPMPFNTTCEPIIIDVYALSWNWSIEQDLIPGDFICNLGGYDPSVPPATFSVSILPFYTVQGTTDYTLSCGNYYTALGFDCNGDGSIFTLDVLDGDDCGGENTATPDFQAGEACITFTATADLSGITAVNPACYVQVPLSSAEDVDGDGDWDGVDIAALQGFPGDAVVEGCYGLIDTYPPTTTCLQPLTPPVCDFITPLAVCSGENVVLSAGPTCEGYNGVIDIDGDGFISPPNDCVSWDADVYVSSTNDPVTGLPTSPGLPTISAPVTSGGDVVDQGYTYLGTLNECLDGSIGAFSNSTCTPGSFEVYIISWNYSYQYDETPGDLICDLGGYTPDGPGCAVMVNVYPEPFVALETPGTCDGGPSSVVINAADGTECASDTAPTTPTTPVDCGTTDTDMFMYNFTAADLGLDTAPTACQQTFMGQIVVSCTSIACCDTPDPIVTPATVCEGNSDMLMATCGAGETTNWYADDGAGAPDIAGGIVGTGGTFSPTDTAPGTYTYYAECVDAGGCASNAVPVTYTINPVPSAAFTCPVLDCSDPTNNILELEPLDNNGVVGATGAWTGTGAVLVPGGGANPGDVVELGLGLGVPGTTYTLIYILTAPGGCTSEAMCTFTFPLEAEDAVVASATVCEGEPAMLTATCGAGETVNWYADDGAGAPDIAGGIIATGGSFSPTDTAPGTYTYHTECETIDFCTGNAVPVTLTIEPNPTIDAPGQPLTCSSGPQPLNPNPTGGVYSGSGAVFVVNDQLDSAGQTFGTYDLTYTIGSCSVTIQFEYDTDCGANGGQF